MADKWKKDWGEDVVPAGASHFSRTEEDGREKEFERHERDVEDRECDAGLDLLDCDIAEAGAFEFSREGADFAEGVDDPAVAESAVDGLLQVVEFPWALKAIGDDDSASGAKDAVRFPDEAGFVRADAVAAAFDCANSVEGFGRVGGVFVITET